MEQRKEIVRHYVSKGLSIIKAVKITKISKSSYYYKPLGTKKGKRPPGYTVKNEQQVSDDEVVARVEAILSNDDFIDYGYFRTTVALKKEGFIINHKKVYRLMKEKKLLFAPVKAGKLAERGFIKYTVPKYEHPFATLEMDIKYIYINGQRRNAYLLTLIDTFTRIALEWRLDFCMKSEQVAELLQKASENHLIAPYKGSSKLMIRTDNGSQFIAKILSEKIKDLPFRREFIHPATPQENAHIESFHNTLGKLVISKYEFEDIIEARQILTNFYHIYNHKRIMKSILYCTPVEFLNEWKKGEVQIKKINKKEIFFRERQLEDPAVLSSEGFLNLIG